MDNMQVRKIAQELGFKRMYVVKTDTLDLWYSKAGEFRDTLISDIKSGYPYAKSVIILVYPYKPYAIYEPILSYYINSNKSYHLANEFIKKISQFGKAELAHIPARALCLKNNIGSPSRNGLLNIEQYGTRIILYTITNDFLEPEEYNEAGYECGSCSICVKACPMGAISDALDVHKCMRYHMETAMHPDFIKEKLSHFIGCEVCQSVCPHNKQVGIISPDDDIKSAFEINRLIEGDCKAARTLVGRNITSNGKLQAEAIIISANRGEIILPTKESQFEAVQDAVRYVGKMQK